MNNIDNILVSVCIMTYNHERFIRKCMDSVLCQKTNFKYEIIIGDDASQDKTVAIVEKWYQDKVKLLARKENVGISRNLYELNLMAKGKYILDVSGDDYLYDENVMQKFADYLEEHENCYSVCGKFLLADKYDYIFGKFVCELSEYTMLDFLRGKKHPTGYGMFRNTLKSEEGTEYLYLQAKNQDECGMMTYLLEHGPQKILNEIVWCYRSISEPGNFENYNSIYNQREMFCNYYKAICRVQQYKPEYNYTSMRVLLVLNTIKDMLQKGKVTEVLRLIKVVTMRDWLYVMRNLVYFCKNGTIRERFLSKEYLIRGQSHERG